MELVVLTGPKTGERFKVPPTGATLGRSRMADIQFEDGMLSRLHCRFAIEHGKASVQDLGSSNGTSLNGVSLGGKPEPLRDGDVVSMGGVALRVRLAADAKPDPRPTEPGKPAGETLPESVDLGLSPDALAEPSAGAGGAARPVRGLLVALSAVAVLALGAWAIFAFSGGSGEARTGVPVERLTAPENLPFEFRYERLAIDARTLFRYTLTYDNAGVLALSIDDLGDADRSFAKTKTLGETARVELRKVLLDSGYGKIGQLFPERSADGVSLQRKSLTIVLGPEVWSRTAENVRNRAFDTLCERLETFGRNELGAWATQYSVAELRALGEEQLRVARRYWEQRDLADETLFECVSAYRQGLSYLETLNPKPAFAEALATGLREAEDLLAQRYQEASFAVDQALNTQRYETAAEALRKILRMIPDRDDPRNMEATERLLSIEGRYLKQGGR